MNRKVGRLCGSPSLEITIPSVPTLSADANLVSWHTISAPLVARLLHRHSDTAFQCPTRHVDRVICDGDKFLHEDNIMPGLGERA